MTSHFPYRHIMVAIDDSDASRRALREAVRLRGLGPGRLTVAHALERTPVPMLLAEGAAWYAADEDYAGRAAEWVRGIAEQAGGEAAVLDGYPPAAVVDWAAAKGADLLVLAAHRGRAERFLLGSFTTFAARHAPCPVLVVRGGEETA